MLDKIKNRISERISELQELEEIKNDDSAIIAEYAHVFQELEELTVAGDPENETRPIEIALDATGKLKEEDEEYATLEMNPITGLIEGMPIDASVETTVQVEYAQLKSENDFIQEATNSVQYQLDESDEEHRANVMKIAHNNFVEYRNLILQEGAYGFSKVSACSEHIPSFATVNFGSDGKSNICAKMEIQHQVDSHGNLTKKQLESVYLTESSNMCANLMNDVAEDMRRRYDIPENENVLEYAIPSILVTTVDPIDQHSVIIGFKNDANFSGLDFYRFNNPVQEFSTEGILEHATVEYVDPAKVRELSKYCITKNGAIKESRKPNPHFHRTFMEAIDIGGNPGDNNQNTNNATPPATDNNQSDMTTNNANQNMDQNSDNNNKAEVNVTTNDVSDDIANKIKNDTENNNQNNDLENSELDLSGLDSTLTTDGDNTDTDINIDNNDTDLNIDLDTSTDGNTTDVDVNATSDDIDGALNDLNANDSSIGDDSLPDNATDYDVNNMTIQQLVDQGTEKVKNMTIGQLKSFLVGDDPSVANIDPAVQEAFILTKANINDEVDVYLKKTLGVLNDNKSDINSIVSEFKKYGKKLNRILTKASKVTAVYAKNEIDELKKLNKCLADLLVTIKSSTDKNTIVVIKRLIKSFTSQAVVVGKIVDKKKKSLPKAELKEVKSVKQESATPRNMSSMFDYFNE